MRLQGHVFALGAIFLMMATPAAAQFTTVVAPPKKAAEAAALDSRVTDPTPRDTGRRTSLKDMSAWVDSVAGSAPTVALGTQVVDSAPGEVVTSADTAAPATERFVDGARAPNTASPLPALLLLGLAAMIAGVALLASPRRAA